MRSGLLFFSVLFLAVLDTHTAGANALEIPEVLKPWQSWVLEDQKEHGCPFLYQDFAQKRCAWPQKLVLDLRTGNGTFNQVWTVYRESWINLPGDLQDWPQDVSLDGRPAAVETRNGLPTLHVLSGQHRIQGRFDWAKMPQSLSLSADTGLIQLLLNGIETRPEISDEGRLWLKSADLTPSSTPGSVEIAVFRRVTDDYPLQVRTHMEIDVSGQARELLLSGALLPDAAPINLESPLPARLEPDGKLRLQLRPGHWIVEFSARHLGPATELRIGEISKPWPSTEVWSFEAQNDLREVEIQGPETVDPTQTRMPQDWYSLPAYRMDANSVFRMHTLRRGDPKPDSDALELERTLWLDFDGKGYTLADHMRGRITSLSRLNIDAPIALGRAAVNGQNRLITRLQGEHGAGVEVRPGDFEMDADSRYQGPHGQIPVIGWAADMRNVTTLLKLSPGWKLIHASGSDNVPDTWITRWSLLDLFVVLLVAVAASRLWTWSWGLALLLTLALGWHEPEAPHYAWINVLAALALCRVLPQGWMLRAARGYRNIAWLALILISVPFLIDLVRTGIYPQLEQTRFLAAPEPRPIALMAPSAEMAPTIESQADASDQQFRSQQSAGKRPMLMKAMPMAAAAPAPPEEVDPGALIQTGPGLPQWEWNNVQFSWSGPVHTTQQLRLWLLPPAGTLVFKFAAAALLILMLFRCFDLRIRIPLTTSNAAALVLLTLLPLWPSQHAKADIPSADMLTELRNRLLKAPECLPQCAQSPRLRIEVSEREGLSLLQEIDAAETIAAPLPAKIGAWIPEHILLDGLPPPGLARDTEGHLWLPLAAGRHELRLFGKLPDNGSLKLSLPLIPQHIEVHASGWSVEGVDEAGHSQGQIQFLRQQAQASDAGSSAPQDIPPFVKILRRLRLGIDFRIETTVTRMAPAHGPLVLSIPLIPGEAVQTPGLTTKDGQILVSLDSEQEEISWQSTLPVTDKIVLRAAETNSASEAWEVDASPQRHVDFSGPAPARPKTASGPWLPEWRPWPGETLVIAVSRPAGVAGPTLTLDQTSLELHPEERATGAELNLRLRSSQGTQHSLGFSRATVLKGASIDGAPQTLRMLDGRVNLPVSPGVHQIRLALEWPSGVGFRIAAPAIDLGSPAVNLNVRMNLPENRWVLLTHGPRLGPAVLFWGELLVIAIAALGLSRLHLVPLQAWQWFLLLIGLSQSPIWLGAAVIGWFLAMGLRGRISSHISAITFNGIQILLGVYTLTFFWMVFSAVKQGLLGSPDMQISGNNSSTYFLNWYQDRGGPFTPTVWVLSVPIMIYRALMLAWALWLAFALLSFLRFAYECYASNGLWKAMSREPLIKKTQDK